MPLRILSLFVLIAGLVLVAIGCGDNDGETREDASAALSEYFADYVAIDQDVNGRIRALKTAYPDNYFDVADKTKFSLQQTKDSFSEYVALFDEFLDRFEDLTAPEQVQNLHRRTLDANQAVNAINDIRLDLLNGLTTAEEVDAIFLADDPEFAEAVTVQHELCVEFEERAADYNVVYDLPCAEVAEEPAAD
jgi:hypothetical protein